MLDNESEPPSIAINSPAEGSTVRMYALVTVTANDNVGVKYVQYLVNGVVVAAVSSSPFSMWWYTRSVANGPVTLTARAVDFSGNSTTSAPVNVIVDNDAIPPQVFFTAPSDSAIVLGIVELNVAATDNEQLQRVEYYDGATLLGSSTVAPYALNWNSWGVANGQHLLTARAFDDAGNSTTSSAVGVQVSNVPPTQALYDATLRAPLCEGPAAACDSADLLDGRGTLGPEIHYPNAVHDSCVDGTTGTYHSAESLDRLFVFTSDGSPLRAGANVKIAAKVWASWSIQSEWLDLYVAQDASNPVWSHVASLNPSRSMSEGILMTDYTLPASGRFVFRGVFRYLGTANPCPAGLFVDVDDMVVDVGP